MKRPAARAPTDSQERTMATVLGAVIFVCGLISACG